MSTAPVEERAGARGRWDTGGPLCIVTWHSAEVLPRPLDRNVTQAKERADQGSDADGDAKGGRQPRPDGRSTILTGACGNGGERASRPYDLLIPPFGVHSCPLPSHPPRDDAGSLPAHIARSWASLSRWPTWHRILCLRGEVGPSTARNVSVFLLEPRGR